MSISYRILPEFNLAYVRYSGRMTVAESVEAFRAYVADPAYRPGQKQIVDLSDVTDWERDYVQIMSLQAVKAEALYDPDHPTTVVSVAPTEMARSVANLVNRTWDRVQGVNYLTAQSEDAALELLGLPARARSEVFGSA
jgi:hypothetical protein